MATVLFVVTGTSRLTFSDGTHRPTGYWAKQAVAPYQVFSRIGHTVVVATPGGVTPVADQASLTAAANDGQRNADQLAAALTAFAAIKRPLRLSDVTLDEYAAVFYPGGHGPLRDLAHNCDSGNLIRHTLASGKPLATIGYGTAALLSAHHEDGAWPFTGYRLTGPAPLRDRLTEAGARFETTPSDKPHIVVDRTLLSGQNTASAVPLAIATIRAMMLRPSSKSRPW